MEGCSATGTASVSVPTAAGAALAAACGTWEPVVACCSTSSGRLSRGTMARVRHRLQCTTHLCSGTRRRLCLHREGQGGR